MKYLIVIFAIATMPVFTFGQPKPAPKNSEQLIAQQLTDPDDSVREKAIESIRTAAGTNPEAISAALRRSWLAPMAKAGFNDDIVRMTQAVVLSSPQSQLALEPMLRARVYALIALGRNDEAMADARRLYVCALDQTGRAIDLLVAAMQAKYGDGADAKVGAFRMNQIAAAAATEEPPAPAATQPAAAAINGTHVSADSQSDDPILSIRLDDKDYMAAAAKWKTNHRQALGYGNLLLMAGHADEAYDYYTDLLNSARTDAELASALERQSAAMRAQDGNLARAQGRLRRLKASAPDQP